MDYSIPKYAHSWLPIRYFKDFGDEENYFIQLEYVINKINYAPELHKALDFDIVAANGKRIFADVDLETLNMLESRNYILLTSIEEPTSNFNDRFYVKEIYGYAPDCEYSTYSDEVVNCPELLMPDGLGISYMSPVSNEEYNYFADSLNIEPPPPDDEENEGDSSDDEITEEERHERLDGLGHLFVDVPSSMSAIITGGCKNRHTGMIEFQIDNAELASKIKKGALVFFYGKGRQVLLQWWWCFLTSTTEISGKIGNKFYLAGSTGFSEVHGGNNSDLKECFAPEQAWYGESITMYFVGNVRKSRNVQCRVTTKVKFYTEMPPLNDFKVPLQIQRSLYTTTGLDSNALTSITSPTASEWIEMASNGEYYVSNGTKMEYRDGLYILSTTYAPYL